MRRGRYRRREIEMRETMGDGERMRDRVRWSEGGEDDSFPVFRSKWA